MIPVYLDNHPAGSSTRPLVHYSQLNDANNRFVNYNFGPEGNLVNTLRFARGINEYYITL